MGYTLVDIVVAYCGGEGPKIVSCSLQRNPKNAQISKIVHAGGQNGERLVRLTGEHPITLAFPEGTIDETSLTMDPTQAVTVQFKDGASEKEAVLFNGLHRTLAMRQIHARSIGFLRSFTTIIEKFHAKNEEDNAAKAKGERDRFYAACKPRFVWCARVYNLSE